MPPALRTLTRKCDEGVTTVILPLANVGGSSFVPSTTLSLPQNVDAHVTFANERTGPIVPKT